MTTLLRRHRVTSMLGVGIMLLSAANALGQIIDWYTIDGGGEMFTLSPTPTNLELSGTIGQPDAGVVMRDTTGRLKELTLQ